MITEEHSYLCDSQLKLAHQKPLTNNLCALFSSYVPDTFQLLMLVLLDIVDTVV